MLARFFPLIASARSLAGDATLPLVEISARLCALAQEEQELPVSFPTAQKTAPNDFDLSRVRLAIYAWIDEILLTADRPDASLWAAYSLQHVFCQTSAAGMLFFQALEELLDGLLPVSSMAGGTGNPDDTQEGDALPARLEAAARIDRAENFARRELDVFALCLLLGFCGRYFEMPQLREKLRVAARKVLQGSEGEKAPPFARESWRGQEIPRALEWLFYALLPLVGAFLFGLYCANLLIDLPKPGF